MRRQYFAHYYKDFGNTYNLMYADTKEELKLVPENAERITRKKAESLCADENYRRKVDSSFSGFADNMIYPVALSEEDKWNLYNSNKYYINKYIWEKVNR